MQNQTRTSEKNIENAAEIVIYSISTGFIDIPGHTSINIYAQGCKNNCKGCHNPELRSFEGGAPVKISDIQTIIKKHLLADWICWLGGDITYQPDGLVQFNKEFKKRGYKICLYTGRYIEDIKDLLEDVDVVVDSPWEGIPVYEEETNQRVWVKELQNWKQIKFNELRRVV